MNTKTCFRVMVRNLGETNVSINGDDKCYNE